MSIQLIGLMCVIFHLVTHQILANGLVSCSNGSRSTTTACFCGNKLIERFDTAIISKLSALLSKTLSLSKILSLGLDKSPCLSLLSESPPRMCGSPILIPQIPCSSFCLCECQPPITFRIFRRMSRPWSTSFWQNLMYFTNSSI